MPATPTFQLNTLSLSSPLWQFALGLWQEPSNVANLMHLQNQYQARVNMLICALWLGKQGIEATKALLEAQTTTQAWHERYVINLRQLKQDLAKGVALREQLAQAELSAEAFEIAQLHDLLAQHTNKQKADCAAQACALNLHALLGNSTLASEQGRLSALIQTTLELSDNNAIIAALTEVQR